MDSQSFHIPRKRKLNGGILITPLIDIVFLVLIFFVMNASFIKPTSLQISLPETESAGPAETGESLDIEIEASGLIRVDGNPMNTENFAAFLRRAREKAEDPSSFEQTDARIFGDAAVSYQQMIRVIDILGNNGIRSVSLIADSAEP
ncbi:MAG: biopolymer transporter ExbD [Spirochaetales bacterium]|nr:biopolymer transporter ExbD [Spirochaetales bacterium]